MGHRPELLLQHLRTPCIGVIKAGSKCSQRSCSRDGSILFCTVTAGIMAARLALKTLLPSPVGAVTPKSSHSSLAQLVALPFPGCPRPLPSPTIHGVISMALLQGMSQRFLPLCYGVSHRQFISAGIWALKPAGEWGYHKRCIPLDERMIRSLELEDGKRNASSGM